MSWWVKNVANSDFILRMVGNGENPDTDKYAEEIAVLVESGFIEKGYKLTQTGVEYVERKRLEQYLNQR